jgi:hypothetical protein
MTTDEKGIILEKNELIAKIQEHKEERIERFLPIFLWSD